MNRLWKWTSLIGGVFVALSLGLMFFYMADKSVVIVEEDEKAETENEREQNRVLRKRLDFKEDEMGQVHLRFGTLVQEDSVTLFHGLEHNEIIIFVEGPREDAMLPREIRADKNIIKEISSQEAEGGVEIVLESDIRYQYEAHWDEEELQLTLTDMEKTYDYIVAVNPAHGGSNRGNAVNNLEEKKITLNIGTALEKIARESAEGGKGSIGVILMRAVDGEISGEARKNFINSGLPDLVLDLHVNADPINEKTFGTSVYYNDNVFPRYITNAELADIMEKELVTEISGKANGIFPDEDGKYPLLQTSYIPSVSVEAGYLTNHQEAVLLGKEKYQEKIAKGLYQGLEAAVELLDGRKKEQ